MNRQLRIRSFTREDWSGFQLLQEKRWWGWKTIDREEVPAHVRICVATCGDTGGWISRFANLPVWEARHAHRPEKAWNASRALANLTRAN